MRFYIDPWERTPKWHWRYWYGHMIRRKVYLPHPYPFEWYWKYGDPLREVWYVLEETHNQHGAE